MDVTSAAWAVEGGCRAGGNRCTCWCWREDEVGRIWVRWDVDRRSSSFLGSWAVARRLSLLLGVTLCGRHLFVVSVERWYSADCGCALNYA